MTNPSSSPTPERIMQFAWGFAPTLILEVALASEIFDFIDQAPRTVEETAAHAKGSERGWRMILNALVGLQFLSKEGDRYSTTPESSTFLVTSKPSFMGGLLRHTSKQLIPQWLHLKEAVQTGKPPLRVNQADSGQNFFETLVSDIFNLSYPSARLLGEHLELAKAQKEVKVLDLATGSGVWGIGLAQQSPKVQVTGVDWPGVVPITKAHVQRFGLESQFNYVAGDLLEVEFPKDQDIATLGHIFHSEGEERSRQLIKKLHQALKPGGTIAIAEFTPNADRSAPPHTPIFAVNMLVHTEKGDTYPFHQVEGWLKDGGFTNVRELPCTGPAPLILATRI